jgi:translation initiation factor IF-3
LKSTGKPNFGGMPRGNNKNFRNNRQESPDAHRINDRIRVSDVRVISETGEQLGIMPTRDALRIAEQAELDLVEVAPEAKPPVCKIMDYGKFKYREQKKQAESKKKRSEVDLKELRIRYRTDKADLDTKLKKARGFLMEGHKVKFSMMFRGREAMYLELGVEKFGEVTANLEDIAVVDEQSTGGGRQIYICYAPKPGLKKS